MNKQDDKQKRLEIANQFIRIISEHGRHFFKFQGYLSCFIIDKNGHLFLVDKYTHKRVYVAYTGEWRGFSDGGTLRRLVQSLAAYIRDRDMNEHGHPLDHLGPWPKSCCNGDLWGYGGEMQIVREKCKKLFEEVI